MSGFILQQMKSKEKENKIHAKKKKNEVPMFAKRPRTYIYDQIKGKS